MSGIIAVKSWLSSLHGKWAGLREPAASVSGLEGSLSLSKPDTGQMDGLGGGPSMTSVLCPLLCSSSLSPVTELAFLQTPHSLYGWRTAQRAQLWGAGAGEGLQLLPHSEPAFSSGWEIDHGTSDWRGGPVLILAEWTEATISATDMVLTLEGNSMLLILGGYLPKHMNRVARPVVHCLQLWRPEIQG